MILKAHVIDIDRILLDPNNPRFFDIEAHKRVSDERYAESTIQKNTLTKLTGNKNFDVQQLKDSINTNGYVPLEKIVVKDYDGKYYVVVEGNRRIAAVKSLIEDYVDGVVSLDDEVIKSLENIEVLILSNEGDKENLLWNELLIQGIRHISGTKEWGAYQKARFIVSLKEDYKKDFSTISNSLGLGPRVTTRYYRTFKALKQMMDDEIYSEFAHPKLFTHFEEMVKSPVIKNWLGWDDEEFVFKNVANLELMYGLISESEDEKGEIVDPRLPAHTDVRAFAKILPNDKARTQFLNGNINVNQALNIANPVPTSPWQEIAKECLGMLNNFKLSDIKKWADSDTDLLDQILEQTKDIKNNVNRLRGKNGEY